ncbi:MAG: hypothetical protein ACYTJ0_08760 [Planctomycetota bacterium]
MVRAVAALEQRLARLPRPAEVTGVDPARAADRRRLSVAGRVVAELPADDVERLHLRVGRAWTDALADSVREAVARDAARRDALAALSTRGLSRRELLDRLVARGHDPQCAEGVVAALAAAGLQDDQALAESVCRVTRRSSPAAPELLRERLRRRQVDDETAQTAVETAMSGVDLVEEAVRLGRQRLRGGRQTDPATALRRVAAALARRGFDEDTVLEALRRLGLDPDSIEGSAPAD